MKILKKVFFFILAILLSYVFVRFLLLQLPGTLADVLSDSETNLKDLEKLTQEFQMNKSFWLPLRDFFSLNWGESQLYHQASLPIIWEHFRLTFRLSILSLVLTFAFSLFFFLFPQKIAERLTNLFLALPAIAVYPAVVYGLCVYTGYCPAGSDNAVRALGVAALTQALLAAPRFYRELEWELDEIRHQRFVLILRAKGLARIRIWAPHIFLNALPPLLSLLLLTLLSFFSGAVLLEALFDLPGIGMLLLDSIRARDFMLIFPLVMFLSVLHLVTLQSGRFLKLRRTAE